MTAPATAPPPHRRVPQEAGLDELAAALERAPRHALDSESNSGFAYRERLCLLQLNVGGELWLVDLPALPVAADGTSHALDRLRPVLESPERRTILHGGEFDVGCLKRDYGLALRGVWDTQQAARLLGWQKTGYAALVEKLCGVALAKGFSPYDWARRPLPERALAYALDDVRYLPRVQQEIATAIAAADLEEELAIANATVETAEWSGGFDPAALWRLKGAGGLPRPALAVLTVLLAWRDRLGKHLDLPPGRVINHRLLLALSRTPPADEAGLRRAGLRGRRLARHGRELLEVLRSARRDPPPIPEPPARERLPPAVRHRRDRLKEWRRQEAARRGLPEQTVLPAAALEHLARHGAGDLAAVPQLGAKRARLYGAQLAELC